MPVSPNQPIYPPQPGVPIEAVWGQAVSEGVIQRFTNAADRDAKWTDAPLGALAYHDNVVWIRRDPDGHWASLWYPLTIQTSVQQVIANDVRGGGTRIELGPKFPAALYPATCMVVAEGYCGYSIQNGTFYAHLANTGENGPQPNWIGWGDYNSEFSWNEAWGGPGGQAQWFHQGRAVIHRVVDQGAKPAIGLQLNFFNSGNAYFNIHAAAYYIPGKAY